MRVDSNAKNVTQNFWLITTKNRFLYEAASMVECE